MPQQFLLTRREILLLGMGTVAGATASFAGKANSRISLFQALNTPNRDFTTTGEQSLAERAKAKGLIYGAATNYSALMTDTKFASRIVQESGRWHGMRSLGLSIVALLVQAKSTTASSWIAIYLLIFS